MSDQRQELTRAIEQGRDLPGFQVFGVTQAIRVVDAIDALIRLRIEQALDAAMGTPMPEHVRERVREAMLK